MQLGIPVAFSGEGVVRDVHFASLPDRENRIWPIGRRNKWPLPCHSGDDLVTFRLHHDGRDLAEHPKVPYTLDLLEAEGYPADLSFLLLYPFGLGTAAGYMDISSIDEMWNILHEIEQETTLTLR